MKFFFRSLFFLFKWTILLVLLVEGTSFIIVSASNYVMYGHIREGSRVIYDANALFRHKNGPRATSCSANASNKPTYRIWMFGGSTMRGQTNNDAHTIPSRLSCLLNKPDSTYHYEISNFGENSFNSLLESKYLQKCLIEKEHKPNLVLFYNGANDSMYFAQYRSRYAHHGLRRFRAITESYYKSFFGVFKSLNAAMYASFTKELLDKFLEVTTPLEKNNSELRAFVDLAEKRYAYIDKVIHCFGADFVLVWQPTLWGETDQVAKEVAAEEQKNFVNTDRFETLRSNFQTINMSLFQKLHTEPYFIDFRNTLTVRKKMLYTPDGVHLNDAGREAVAQNLAKTLREKGILPL